MRHISLQILIFGILFTTSICAKEELVDPVPVFVVSGEVKKPQRIVSYQGATLGDVIEKSGGLSMFAHVVFVCRRCLDADYVYSFDFRMLRSKPIALFPLRGGDRIHVSGKQVFVSLPKIPSEITVLIGKNKTPCYRVDYAVHEK